jgi:hypothetical protein
MVYIYISPSSQKEKMKQKKEMNIFHLAHISISIFCRSHLFSVDAASYFLVVRHRLSFFCARDRKFRKKKHKKTRERERLPISFLMSVFISYLGVVNTHIQFFCLVFGRISSERTKKKLIDEKCLCVHTHI